MWLGGEMCSRIADELRPKRFIPDIVDNFMTTDLLFYQRSGRELSGNLLKENGSSLSTSRGRTRR